MGTSTEVIVVGLGIIGSAVAWDLARRGRKVIGIDQYPPGHAFGSSHGLTRIIRLAYYQSPHYVPMARRSYELWDELERTSGRSLLTMTGGLNISERGGMLVTGVEASAKQYGLDYEILDSTELAKRFPGFQIPEHLSAAWEPESGVLHAEACLQAQLDEAKSHGAMLRHGEHVVSWNANDQGVTVETDAGAYQADYLVLAAGPWTSKLLHDVAYPLEVQRIVNVHFQPSEPAKFHFDHTPIHLWYVPEGHFYGFPYIPEQGLKLGLHYGPVTDPDEVQREIKDDEFAPFWALLNTYMPGSAESVIKAITCLYTNTPDKDFIIDRHPNHDRVTFCAGFSGHGFKFAPAIGELVGEMIEHKSPKFPVEFMRADRFEDADASR